MTRIEWSAGSPDALEVGAVTAAILALAASAAPAPPRRSPAWTRAARLEQIGEAPLHAASDPRLASRG